MQSRFTSLDVINSREDPPAKIAPVPGAQKNPHEAGFWTP